VNVRIVTVMISMIYDNATIFLLYPTSYLGRLFKNQRSDNLFKPPSRVRGLFGVVKLPR
jgi:hypothetical protein